MKPQVTLKLHGFTRTLCDAEYGYYDHDDKLVRQSLNDSDQIQQYGGSGRWVDRPPGWGARANFLMPGGETTPLHYLDELDAMIEQIDKAMSTKAR